MPRSVGPLGPLPPPTVVEPFPMGCEAFVRIGGVIDGAAVTVWMVVWTTVCVTVIKKGGRQ